MAEKTDISKLKNKSDEKIEAMSNKEVEQTLKTNFKTGLTDEEAEQRLEQDGLNELPKGKVRPWYVTFLLALVEPLQIILILAAVISVITPMIGSWKANGEDFIDFAVIILIVLIDAILGTVQAVKARKSVDALKSLSKPRAVVLRNGQQFEIDADHLVVGDIVIIEAGKYIPAELRIIESSEFQVDESILTGESLPVKKVSTPVKASSILAEQENICFMNSYATNGRAIGVVFAIGEDTEIGKIAKTINENANNETPLEKKLNKFSYWIAILAVVLGIVIFVCLFFTGQKSTWSDYLMVAITLAIGVIPESLSAVVSVTLAVSTKRMAQENVIVKKLSSVETLGSVNIICTDKTGTLTQNRMTVKKVIMNGEVVDDIKFIQQQDSQQKELFLKALVLPNDSVTDGESRIGDPTELALVDYAEKMGIDELASRKKWIRIDEMPFDSERKLMTTINKIDDQPYTFTKGAIDELLKKCTKIMQNNKVINLTPKMKKDILALSAGLSDQALRVLGFAYSPVPEADKEYENNLTFIGAVGMIDPVRTTAVRAVKEAHDAGIQVVMITGDHATTALAIARELNIAQTQFEVMTSEQLEKYSDEELKEVISHVRVFARVNPEHKVRIVEAFQANGNIVSMTGDGVNDAPSLAIADIGVAMGITGTDVAKQAADVILTDDNFATIMRGVDEGRNVYQKIKRTIVYLMGINLGNVLSILILSIINHIAPLEATDILFIGLIVESLLAIVMGMGPVDSSIMKIPPVKGKNGLLKGIMWPIIKLVVIFGGLGIASFYVGMLATPDNYLHIANTAISNTDGIEKYAHLSADGNTYIFNSWHSIMNFNGFAKGSNVKINTIVFGRTAIFITTTMSPTMIAHIIKLTNWKLSKHINWSVNKPLLVASAIGIVADVLALFIPGLNDTVFSLVSSSVWSGSNCWVIFSSIGFAIAIPALMLLSDATVFFVYHYMPKPWIRNRQMVRNMVKADEQKRLELEAKQRKSLNK